jgi:predicted ribosome-associated RNA-binding protein Tma20
MLFSPEGNKPNATVFPSLYFMFNEMNFAHSEEGVLRLYVKFGVESFLFNGADLMWPGVFACSREHFK